MKKILLLIFAGLAFCINGKPMRGISAAKGIEYTVQDRLIPENPTAADYIQDGLIAMWDGIENVDWGVHNNNATVWKDLVGNVDAIVDEDRYFSENALVFPTQTKPCSCNYPAPEYRTIQLIFRRSTYSARVIFQSGNIHRQVIANVSANYANWYFDGRRNNVTTFQERYAQGTIPQIIDTLTAVFGNELDAYNPTYVEANGIALTPKSYGYNSQWSSKSYCNVGGHEGNPSSSFAGEIFCIRLYSHALTAEEIEYNNLIDKERFNLP